MNTRAEALAHRIEQGAQILAEYAQRLTDAEWNTIARPDRRKIGVIIHHVASVYPIEMQLAYQVAAGQAIEEVSWNVVASMNAIHARENTNVGKFETIHLLERNSRAAAQAVRALTEEELDRAAPVSLYLGAPVTTQFIIEDHALRHSWHHLAKIQAALRSIRPATHRPMLVPAL